VSRERILALIQDPPDAGVLAGVDASGLDLSSDAIGREVGVWMRHRHVRPLWHSDATGGINLAGWRLAGAHFDGGKVWRGDFERSDLSRASFRYCDAGVCRFADADLVETDFTGATLARANFRGSSLDRTRLCDADLRDADLTGATLDHVYLAGVTLANTRLRRSQLSAGVGEELDGDYGSAVSAYAALKSNFRNLGLFEEASWAYMQERRMETKALAPWRRDKSIVSRVACGLRWLGGCLSGLVVGYGERPLRAVAFVPFFVAAYALLYWLLGDLTVDGTTAAGLGACFRHSLASFVTLSTSGAQAVRPRSAGAQVWTSLEALTGVSLIALVMFSLGKRITRS
jgi:uncharacterized protein YjbI with pentapeptide repeats